MKKRDSEAEVKVEEVEVVEKSVCRAKAQGTRPKHVSTASGVNFFELFGH
ncbi:hypothetical protein [Flexistipes sinusarabici]|nr:hypothetical protein [Flexistipes sinusarabici]